MREMEIPTEDREEIRPPMSFESLFEEWDGEAAVIRRDSESGAWIFVCLHSTRLGPAGGGTRMKVYATPAEALEDAMRLSAAMTRKLAIAGLPFGGGKAVLAVPSVPSGEQRRALLLRYGDLVASLGGTYRTSSDINTNEADMDVIGERTEYVFGRSRQAGGSGNPERRPPSASFTAFARASSTHSARLTSKSEPSSCRAPAELVRRSPSTSLPRARRSSSRTSIPSALARWPLVLAEQRSILTTSLGRRATCTRRVRLEAY